jgi:5-methylcytosine-specific restriction endonuclease McrA
MTCAYCHQPCDGLPDPEHVIPISRGGDNSMSNIVAACRQCNADKRDLTPKEWAADRQRRGLEPVDTSLAGHAFKHLALTEAHALAA